MAPWNVFRVLGDISHILSKCILIFAIHRNKSAEGVSLITQGLYAVVFCTRYLDLPTERWPWNKFFKIFYIVTSFYIIAIMRWVYPRTREREIAWKIGAVCLAGSLVLSPFTMLIFAGGNYSALKWMHDFSEILESVCVLPQLLLLRQTTVPTVIDSFYLLTLGSYRGFYVLNWIWREADTNDSTPDPVSVIFGVVQTALYIDFAWVYWTRQRVKLRGGGIVDADDIRRGWLLSRIFGKHVDVEPEDDEENAPALGGSGGRNGHAAGRAPRAKWGARGISISADDGVLNQEDALGHEEGVTDEPVDPDAKMRDPDELALALDDDDDAPPPPPRGETSGVRGGDEWDDD